MSSRYSMVLPPVVSRTETPKIDNINMSCRRYVTCIFRKWGHQLSRNRLKGPNPFEEKWSERLKHLFSNQGGCMGRPVAHFEIGCKDSRRHGNYARSFSTGKSRR